LENTTSSDDSLIEVIQMKENVLDFYALTVNDRLILLLEMFNSHRIETFNARDIDQMKALRLYTPYNVVMNGNRYEQMMSTSSSIITTSNEPISIRDCTGGVFWCSSEAVIETIRAQSLHFDPIAHNESNTNPETNPNPTILIYDERLKPIYQMLEIEELTATTAVRKFILPTLAHASADKKLEIMMTLSQRYAIYTLIIRVTDHYFT
jgi:hypothetical protein